MRGKRWSETWYGGLLYVLAVLAFGAVAAAVLDDAYAPVMAVLSGLLVVAALVGIVVSLVRNGLAGYRGRARTAIKATSGVTFDGVAALVGLALVIALAVPPFIGSAYVYVVSVPLAIAVFVWGLNRMRRSQRG